MDFAGRWSNDLFSTDEQKKQIEAGTLDKTSIPNYLCYADNQELADQVISQFLSWRKEAMTENLPQGDFDLKSAVDNYQSATERPVMDRELSMDLWRVERLSNLLMDEWSDQSAVYDLFYGTANLEPFHKRCAKAPQKQFLIPVDFHH
jgi:hypothetical protein